METDADERLWQNLVDSEEAYIHSSHAFLHQAHNRIGILRRVLVKGIVAGKPVVEKMTALEITERLTEQERMQALPELLRLSVSPKFGSWARRLILALPHEWLRANLERFVEPVLEQADSTDYSSLIGFFQEVSPPLALKVARAAAASSDADIQYLGRLYLEQLEPGDNPGKPPQ